MARSVKNDYLGGRVDDELKEQVEQYIDDANMTKGELVRIAVIEYMKNHPIEQE